jgi:hypothetical protein
LGQPPPLFLFFFSACGAIGTGTVSIGKGLEKVKSGHSGVAIVTVKVVKLF